MTEKMFTNAVTGKSSYTATFSAGTSAAIFIPGGIRTLGISLVPAGGAARVEYTFSGRADIDAGTANWAAWPKGDVTAYSDDGLVVPVTAVRVVVAAGSAKLQMVA